MGKISLSPKLMWLNKFINHITKRGSLLEMVLNKAIATRSSKENDITVAKLDIGLLTAAALGRIMEVQARRLPVKPM
mgnify:CR=1 FL=1